jgi:acyl carrier protein
LEVLGRTDSQVKIRGFRVETSEIEDCLHSHRDVAEAAVQGEGDPPDMRLICYIVPKPQSELTVTALKAYLCDRFPDYMIPSKFTLLSERLPRTANGKVNRQVLATLVDASESESLTGYVPPKTNIEVVVAQMFCEVLHLERVGITNDFLELGGHSILGIKVISRIRDQFGVEIPFQTLFAPSNVGELAALIALGMASAIAEEAP